jgi:aspartate/methionine/tyrosine aminotransferase
MPQTEPWSKKHKRVTGGLPHNLSNSFAEPLSHAELVEHCVRRGDRKLVDAYNNHSLEYTPNGGSLDLRQEIAKLYGPSIGAENVLVFAGAQVALQTAALALLDSNAHAIVFTPGYQSVQEAPVHAGSAVTRIQLTAASGWQIDLLAVQAAIRPSTKYIVVNLPHNPSGTLLSREAQAQLTAIAEPRGIYIMSDEVSHSTA